MLSLHFTVIRNGERIEIEAEKLVPGDIVVLVSGDKVPADLRLLAGKGLRVNESILTGESQAAEKTPAPVLPDAPLGDRLCMLYSGTLVVSGHAPLSLSKPASVPSWDVSAPCWRKCGPSPPL